MTISIELRLFSWVRERAGASQMQVQVPSGTTAREVLNEIAAAGHHWAQDAAACSRVAVNRVYAAEDQVLCAGDEIAIIPPVSGGGPVQASITSQPIDLEHITSLVATPSAGAVVTFQGLPRDIAALDYEAFGDMAGPLLESLALEVADLFAVEALAVEHRTGLVPSGEPSVAIAVATAHRKQAFDAAQLLMDRLKTEIPIWKTEVERLPV